MQDTSVVQATRLLNAVPSPHCCLDSCPDTQCRPRHQQYASKPRLHTLPWLRRWPLHLDASSPAYPSEHSLDPGVFVRVVQSSMAVVATEELPCTKNACRAERDASNSFRIRIPARLSDQQLRVRTLPSRRS